MVSSTHDPRRHNYRAIPVEDTSARLKPLLPRIMELDAQIVASGKYVYGSLTAQLEAALKAAWGVRGDVVLTNSGTSGLIIAMWAAEIAPGDEVIVPNLTFISTAYAVTMAGGVPVFVDVDPATMAVDPQAIEAAITPRTRALVAVHMYGYPADMPRIMEIARRHGLRVIEDTSQAHGARSGGQYVGTIGDLAAGSLYAYKNLGGFGDLGYVILREPDPARVQQILRWRDLGRDPGARHAFHCFGLRARPEEKNAGVAGLLLPTLERENARSRDIAARYDRGLADTPVTLLHAQPGCEPVYWRYTILLSSQEERAALVGYLKERGIGSQIVYPQVVSEQEVYAHGAGEKPCRVESTPCALDASRRVLSLPMYAQLTDEQTERVIAVVCSFYSDVAPLLNA